MPTDHLMRLVANSGVAAIQRAFAVRVVLCAVALWAFIFVGSEAMCAGPVADAADSAVEPADRSAGVAMPRVDFNQHILPILSDKCFHCHGPDAQQRQGELRLDVRGEVFAERDGRAIISPGAALASELYVRIASDDPDERMPPAESKRKLTGREIQLIQRWIDEGATWEEHWAFITPKRPRVPNVTATAWSHTPIDRFVLSQLEAAGLQPAVEADRETLLRRVTFDLTGLPPTPAEVEVFVNDNRADAYEQLVDRLLSSLRYGEHLAVPWLDAARYADTDGYQNDRLRYMWAWRDWVIRALNANMPFDQFTIEQLAGDMLPNATFYQQIATGFCRNHRINSEGGAIPAEWQVEYVVDRVDTLGTVWLGLTMGCARCHDHKYDPVTQREYYSLFAYFNNVPEWGLGPNDGNSPPFVRLPDHWPNLKPDEAAVVPEPYELVTSQTSVVRPKPGDQNTAMVMQELPAPRPTYLLKRGVYNQPDKSQTLAPSVPGSLHKIAGSVPTNRLELARWLVHPDHPLTSRVIVNRYWQHFFGLGLVKTSENFGIQGERPSHPELLDWLAREFVSSGWNVKAIQRLIVTSAVYRQSSAVTPALLERDPENRWLARGPRIRLSAQVMRDQALAMSGLLIEEVGGPSVKPYMPPGLWRAISNSKYVQSQGKDLYRRSIYTYWRRTVPPPTMMNFNAAEREVCIVRKDRTTTPMQALTLMNNVTFVESARFLAEEILDNSGSQFEDRLDEAFRRMVGRLPSPQEVQLLRESYQVFYDRFRKDRSAAEKLLSVGEKPASGRYDVDELAAMTMLASTIMNLDEFVHKD